MRAGAGTCLLPFKEILSLSSVSFPQPFIRRRRYSAVRFKTPVHAADFREIHSPHEIKSGRRTVEWRDGRTDGSGDGCLPELENVGH